MSTVAFIVPKSILFFINFVIWLFLQFLFNSISYSFSVASAVLRSKLSPLTPSQRKFAARHIMLRRMRLVWAKLRGHVGSTGHPVSVEDWSILDKASNEFDLSINESLLAMGDHPSLNFQKFSIPLFLF